MATQQSTAGKSRPASRTHVQENRASIPDVVATQERDEVHGLVSVLYHALQGAETYARYMEDARRSGDDELLEFFEECQDEEADRADRAKELLVQRLDATGGGEDDEDDEDEEAEDEEEIEER